MISGATNAGKFAEPRDIDENARCGKSQLHEGNQRVPTSQQLGVVAVRGECIERLGERAGTNVAKGGRNHWGLTFVAAHCTDRTIIS